MRQVYRSPQRAWSVDLIRAAERSANVGDISLFAEMASELLSDDRIPGVLRTRTHALLGTRMDFVHGSERVRQALDDGDAWKICPTRDLNEIMLWGLLTNACPVRKTWDTSGPRDIVRIERWDTWALRYDLWNEKTTIETTMGAVPFEAPTWTLYSPFGGARPWQYGLARGLARFWLLKQYAIDDWGRHSETASRLVATEAQDAHGSDARARAQLADELDQAGKDQVIVLPKGFDLKLVEVTANTRDIYDAQIAAANTAFAVAVLGHNLTTEVTGGGSYAAGGIGNDVRSDLRHFDDEGLSSWLHDEVYADYVDANFPGDEAAWPAWEIDAPRDKKVAADALGALANAISVFRAAEAPVDVESILEQFDVPMMGQPKRERRRR